MRLLTVIPARLGATRLPNKPLRLLAGEPLIRAVARNAQTLGLPGEIVVATDDAHVVDAVRPLGIATLLTDPGHESGTERVHEVARHPRYAAVDILLNLQGDEPFVTPAAAFGALARVKDGDQIGTAGQPLPDQAIADPNRVKVEVSDGGLAIRFFRSSVADDWSREEHPLRKVLQHVGIYAFTRKALEQWMKLPKMTAEAEQGLEQLRPLAGGMTIGVAELTDPVRSGVDTEEDLRMAEVTR